MTDVVLVHGGWHDSTCWDEVVQGLAQFGLTANCVQLPFTGFASDVDAVRAEIDLAGPSTVVMAHSYGGAVVSQAAAQSPNVSRLIYLAAFMLEHPEEPGDFLSPELAASLRIQGRTLLPDLTEAGAIFYGDLPERDALLLASRLRPMTVGRTSSESPPAWQIHPATYVVCTNDRAIPPEHQRRMAARAQNAIELPTDHSPFLTQPCTIAGLLADAVARTPR